MDEKELTKLEEKKNDDWESMKTIAKEALIDGVTVFSASWIIYQIGQFIQICGEAIRKAKETNRPE